MRLVLKIIFCPVANELETCFSCVAHILARKFSSGVTMRETEREREKQRERKFEGKEREEK